MSLKGIRVVDLTRIISGPFCSQLLADLGADVIKIETLGGDPLREQGEKVNDFSWYFAGYNRNKRSVSVDLYSEEGRQILRRILATADVLVENFRPGVLDKMGLSNDELSAISPKLIVCHISGFGADGPYAQRPAFDFIAQALSGFMSINGTEDGPGLRSGLPVSDLVAGLYGALGIVSRLAGRSNSESNDVQSVDISLTDSMISLLSFTAANYLAAGKPPKRHGNDHPLVAPYGVFETSDGAVAVAPSNDGVYLKLLKALELENLISDERINTNSKRMASPEILREILNPIFKSHSSAYWIENLNAAGVPVGPILTVPEVFEDAQVQHRQMVMDVDHGAKGDIKMLGFPLKFDQEPCELRRPAPLLGQHNEEVLAECGYTAEDMDALRRREVLGTQSG
ncbi:MAG: CoA transferase [Pseudomonadota bacterium]